MKIWGRTIKPAHDQAGGVMLGAMCVAGVLGFALASYLMLSQGHFSGTVRSEAWNRALCLAEAGAEEALANLNPGACAPILNPTANHWFPEGGDTYAPEMRVLPTGSYRVLFEAGITPTIYSTGYVHVPSLRTTLARAVQVNTTNSPLFTTALAVRSNIIMNSSGAAGIFADSFDSFDRRYNTNGWYPFGETNRIRANGAVVCANGIVDLGRYKILGDLLLGPSAAMIGTNSPALGMRRDFAADFPNAVFPSINWLPPAVADHEIDGTHYDYAFYSSGDYQLPSSGSIYVGPRARVRVQITTPSFVANNLRVAGIPDSGSLTIYMLGSRFTLAEDAVVDSGNPSRLRYFGSTSNAEISFYTTSTFVGTIYAPTADLKWLNTSHSDFIGSCVAKSLASNGQVSFHFDENLLRADAPIRGLLVSSWRELY